MALTVLYKVPVQSVPITKLWVRISFKQGVLKQHYVILKFVSDFQQVDVFLRVLRFPPPLERGSKQQVMNEERTRKCLQHVDHIRSQPSHGGDLNTSKVMTST